MTRHFTLVGLGITAVWCGLAVGYAAFHWPAFLALQPNELGDFFAGVLSPLAFLWLVLGYFQQGQELKLSTEALRLQAEELRNAVEQQRELVQATREQVAFEKEQNERDQIERSLAAAPRFEISGGGSAPSSMQKPGWRRFFVRISNTGAPVTAVRVIASGWHRQQEPLASFDFLDRGSSQNIEVDMPMEAFTGEAVLTFSYIDSLGQDGTLKLRKPEDSAGSLEFSRVEG